jgi:hypothetical protein
MFDDLHLVSGGKSHYDKSSGHAFAIAQCWNCAGQQMAVIAYSPSDPGLAWLRCINCGAAAVSNSGRVAPATLPLTEPLGVVGREAEIWREARECLAVGAVTAVVMLCRKLLLHVAVAHGLDEEGAKGRTPTFDTAVKHLESVGVITSRMQPWVDRIREVGNGANHDLTPISPAQADDVAKFTEQLLRLAYEMDALMANPTAATPEVAPEIPPASH